MLHKYTTCPPHILHSLKSVGLAHGASMWAVTPRQGPNQVTDHSHSFHICFTHWITHLSCKKLVKGEWVTLRGAKKGKVQKHGRGEEKDTKGQKENTMRIRGGEIETPPHSHTFHICFTHWITHLSWKKSGKGSGWREGGKEKGRDKEVEDTPSPQLNLSSEASFYIWWGHQIFGGGATYFILCGVNYITVGG